MIISDIPQGTPEWLALRAGLPTASNFDKIVTSKGEVSKSRVKYMYQLAGESITGVKEDVYQNAIMARGSEMEAEARNLYELATGKQVQTVGLCYHDSKMYGCSPDGLIGDGLIEIKCPTLAVHVEYLLNGTLPVAYFQQVQGQLLVTGKDWCDFVSYYPAMRLLIVRVERDNAFIKILQKELNAFCDELQTIIKKLK